jgi:predicted regulator of Ras-like GTPase activity (Roadblock/LC7/MglB family)
MDPAQALADLTEISTQIRTAVLVDARGDVVASSVEDRVRAETIARAARQLVSAAEETMGGPEARETLVQLQVATPDGCVFVVKDEERLVAAVTSAEPTVGLVFYDLKTCLRHAAGEDLAPKPMERSGGEDTGAGNGTG